MHRFVRANRIEWICGNSKVQYVLTKRCIFFWFVFLVAFLSYDLWGMTTDWSCTRSHPRIKHRSLAPYLNSDIILQSISQQRQTHCIPTAPHQLNTKKKDSKRVKYNAVTFSSAPSPLISPRRFCGPWIIVPLRDHFAQGRSRQRHHPWRKGWRVIVCQTRRCGWWD